MPKRIGQILLDRGLLSPQDLETALKIQQEQGGRLGWILATLGMVRRVDLFQALADHYSLPFGTPRLDEWEQRVDTQLLTRFSAAELLEKQAFPVRLEGKTLTLLNAYPGNLETERFFLERSQVEEVHSVVITDLDLLHLVQRFFRQDLLSESVTGLFYRNPEESAFLVFSRPQMAWMFVLVALVGFAFFLAPSFSLQFGVFLCQFLFLVLVGFKFLLSVVGSIDEIIFREPPRSFYDSDPEALPVYTVLVPVFKEPEVVETLIQGLKNLDYPQSKLDVILLLEEVDSVTLEAAKKASPPSNWRFLVVPKAQPQTKPKACNYGLFFARGKYLVIFDAEDVPQPDQLKKALYAFENSDPSTICFQAALNYFNRDQNLLTRLFTLEYSYWFDYMLPGLFRLNLPIPLGGTSNHFKVKELREIGGWDPFNTTEDADLGIRAAAQGYRVGIIRSTTFEEANSQVWNWIRQRSRWIKGYMQTSLVYNRHPLRMLKTLGWKRWISFQLFIGGTPLVFLVNPILWGLFFTWLVFNPAWLAALFSPWVLLLALFNFLIGNFLGIYMNMLGAFRRKFFSLILVSILNPLYWILHSIAAYKGLWQLLTRPHYWEKTVHGLSRGNSLSSPEASNHGE